LPYNSVTVAESKIKCRLLLFFATMRDRKRKERKWLLAHDRGELDQTDAVLRGRDGACQGEEKRGASEAGPATRLVRLVRKKDCGRARGRKGTEGTKLREGKPEMVSNEIIAMRNKGQKRERTARRLIHTRKDSIPGPESGAPSFIEPREKGALPKKKLSRGGNESLERIHTDRQ